MQQAWYKALMNISGQVIGVMPGVSGTRLLHRMLFTRAWVMQVKKEGIATESYLKLSWMSSIRKAAHYCQPTGDTRFKESIERQLGRKLGYAKRGRPRKGKPEVG